MAKKGNTATKKAKSTPKKTSLKSSASKAKGGDKSSQRKRSFRPLVFKLMIIMVLVVMSWLVYLDATIRSTFEGQRWDIPARVYARPLELFEGAALNPELFEIELKGLGYQYASRTGVPATYYRTGDTFSVYSRGFVFSDGEEKAQKFKINIKNDVVNSLRDQSGRDLGSVRLDPLAIGGIYPAHHEDRILVSNEQIPELLPKALVVIEDKEFWEHFGISIKGIVRALWVNVTSGEVVQGGSTLTQQLIKNFYLDSRRTLWRKAKEAVMAILLDWHYEKPEIMEAYLNEVYLGQSGKRAIHGFGLASQFYFAQPLERLDIHQVAMLVAMVKGPTYYNPRRNPDRAKKRRNLVLKELAKSGVITANQAEIAQNRNLDVSARPLFTENLYPAFFDLVRRQLKEDYRKEDLETKGLRIFTTIDPQVQNRTERAVKDVLNSLDSGRKQQLESAVIVTGLESGEVKALVGGRDTRYAGFNRVLDARRQIGSLVKPAVYLTALGKHSEYNLATRLEDKTISLEMPNGDIWSPRNFENKEFNDVSLHEALSHSMNLATARLGLAMGTGEVIDTLEQLGVEKGMLSEYPSLFLGAVSLTPYQVASMYQTIAASGFNMPVRAIREVTDSQGNALQRYPYTLDQVIDSRDIHLLQYVMQETMREGTGKSAYRWLPDALATAGKTGTTNDSRDSWFSGMTGDYLTVAWVGRDDNGSTRLTGATGAMRVWSELTRRIPQRPFSPIVPEDVSYVWVMDDVYARTDAGCSNARKLPFVSGTAPERFISCGSGFQKIKGWFQNLFDD